MGLGFRVRVYRALEESLKPPLPERLEHMQDRCDDRIRGPFVIHDNTSDMVYRRLTETECSTLLDFVDTACIKATSFTTPPPKGKNTKP